MKKFISKTKRVIGSIVLAIISFPNKILAVINPIDIESEPGPKFGIPIQITVMATVWKIARNFIIPIALLIGLIVYFKKSKSSKKKKVLVTIGIIAITVILYLIVDKNIYEL